LTSKVVGVFGAFFKVPLTEEPEIMETLL
jgi:hypothetical protein